MCKNKQDLYRIDVSNLLLQERAEKLFWSMSGFSKENPPSPYQKDEVQQMEQKLQKKIKVKVLLQKLHFYRFEEGFMTIEDKTIYYDLPLYLYKDQIIGAYAFLVSEETLANDRQDTLDQLYTHMWQNAYLDAAREWVKEYLSQQTGEYVSSCISPGFYGIDLAHMKTMYQMVDGKSLGVSVREDGLLYPEKSVLGMYLLLKHEIDVFGKQCNHCLAQGKNCEFCVEKIEKI